MNIEPRVLEAQLQLRMFFASTGAKKAIIGVSGGVDSALVLSIAVHALGKENIIALCLPYRVPEISSLQNLEDAQNLCVFFGVENKTLMIDDFAKPYESIFSGMAFANTLARIRMSILFGTANQTNGVVLGTCNKSEIMLGYETKFGDGAADVSVIGNLWKTEVWEWAKYYHLPDSFITKAPSAELFIGQTDEKEMGFTYQEADHWLQQKNISTASDPIARKIYALYTASAHKRSPVPILIF